MELFAEYFRGFWQNHKFYLMVDEQWRRRHRLCLVGYGLAWALMPVLLVSAFALRYFKGVDQGMMQGCWVILFTYGLLGLNLNEPGKFQRSFGWIVFALGLVSGGYVWYW